MVLTIMQNAKGEKSFKGMNIEEGFYLDRILFVNLFLKDRE